MSRWPTQPLRPYLVFSNSWEDSEVQKWDDPADLTDFHAQKAKADSGISCVFSNNGIGLSWWLYIRIEEK